MCGLPLLALLYNCLQQLLAIVEIVALKDSKDVRDIRVSFRTTSSATQNKKGSTKATFFVAAHATRHTIVVVF